MFYPGQKLKFNFNEKKGFTLLELLVAVAIVGLLVGIAVPNIAEWGPRYRLKSATRDLVSNMIKSKSQAVTENTPYVFEFIDNAFPAADTYTIFIPPSTNNPPPGTTLGPFELSSGHPEIEYSAINLNPPHNPPRLVFRSNGTVMGTGGDITLRNRSGESYTIDIFITGALKVTH